MRYEMVNMCDKDKIVMDRLKNVEGLLKATWYCEDCETVMTIYGVKNFDKLYNPQVKLKHQFGFGKK
jgi:hypothetical protein